VTKTQIAAGQVVPFYTDPNTGRPIPCVIHSRIDGSYDIELITGKRGVVTAGDLSCEDESGHYLGGPGEHFPES
jgi:hypothetical protein